MKAIQSVLIIFTCILVCQYSYGEPDIVDIGGRNFYLLDYKELGTLELTAEEGRNAFWQGNFEKAESVFKGMTQSDNPSTGLYLRELAMCQLAQNKTEEAKSTLMKAISYFDIFANEESEREALKKSKREIVKVYSGDPYERSQNYFLLALMFLNDDDPDNALAACKSGLLADSDAVENLYQSDFTALYLLEAKCYDLRGESTNAEASRRQALESYQTTHPDVRDLFAERLEMLERFKLSPKELKRMEAPNTPGEIRMKIDELTERINEASAAIDVVGDLGDLYTGNFDTLIVLPDGMSVKKRQHGSNLEAVIFEAQKGKGASPTILINGQAVEPDWIENVASVDFHATTRGGRRMDAILRGEASYKRGAYSIGNYLNEQGGIFSIIGAVAQIVGSNVSPDADTRCWRCLPSEWKLLPMNLKENTYDIKFVNKMYYKNTASSDVSIQGSGFNSNSLNIVWAPLQPSGAYSEALFDISSARKRRPPKFKNNGDPKVILPPVLALDEIEYFRSADPKESIKAIAPNPERITKSIVSSMKKSGFDAVYVSHKEASEGVLIEDNPDAKVLQLYYNDASLDRKENKSYEYTIDLSYEWIDPHSGTVIKSGEKKSVVEKGKKDKTPVSSIFDEVFESSTGSLLNDFPSGTI